MVASKVIAIDKNMFGVGSKVTIIALIYVILICLQVTTLRTKSSHSKEFCKKSVFENFAKSTENIFARVFFLNKDSGRWPATSL